MSRPGPFRFVDRILEYASEERIVTLTDLSSRKDLLNRFGFSSLLLEIAAQSCGLMNRVQHRGTRDSFLGKVRHMAFHEPFFTVSPLSTVRTLARRISGTPDLTRYQGKVESFNGTLLADFDLLICTAELGGRDTDGRRRYWQNYLDQLGQQTFLNTNGERFHEIH